MNGEEREILDEIRSGVKDLKHNLYGISLTDKGDIGEIKDSCKTLRCDVDDLKPKVVRLETVVKVIAGLGGSGGATAGILKALGVF